MLSRPFRPAACLRAAVIAAFAFGATPALEAQVVRGTVRAERSLLPLEQATVSVRDKQGQLLGRGITDVFGSYSLSLRADTPFDLEVRRLGYRVGLANVKALQLGDTVDFEFLMTEVAAVSDAVVITAESTRNDRRLETAERRGWKVYSPELVMRHRDQARDIHQLLQSLGNPSLILPRSLNECVRSTRMNRCLVFVVDDQVMGPLAVVQPSDIHFIAILSASDSRAEFGERAPFGAIAVYTRSRLDRVQQPRRAPPEGRRRPPTGAHGGLSRVD